MKTKGFTLIELLAVIVILAIIALIATPVVLNIINDSKNSSIERSAELYLDQVKNEIARYNMIHPGSNFNPSECIVQSDNTLNCDGTSLTVEISGDKPSAGSTILLSNGTVTSLKNFIIDGKNISLIDGNCIIADKIICNRVTSSKVGNVPQGKYKAGDEYTCKVNDTTSYNFYILNTNGNKVNMIMDRNICSDGTAATASNTCYVLWTTKEDYIAAGGTESEWGQDGNHNKGPITALSYLNKATSSWSNIPNLSENYTDYHDGRSGRYYYGYGTIKLTGKARLISHTEVDPLIETYTYEMNKTSQKFLLNNLKSYSKVSGTNNISNIEGYWAMDTSIGGYSVAWAVGYVGEFLYGPAFGGKTWDTNFNDISASKFGVRPVITLDKSNLQ